MMLAQALRAELAAVYGVILIAAHRNGLPILDADLHAASDRAISAGGLHPSVGNSGGGHFAEARVIGVAVFPGQSVDAELASEAC